METIKNPKVKSTSKRINKENDVFINVLNQLNSDFISDIYSQIEKNNSTDSIFREAKIFETADKLRSNKIK